MGKWNLVKGSRSLGVSPRRTYLPPYLFMWFFLLSIYQPISISPVLWPFAMLSWQPTMNYKHEPKYSSISVHKLNLFCYSGKKWPHSCLGLSTRNVTEADFDIRNGLIAVTHFPICPYLVSFTWTLVLLVDYRSVPPHAPLPCEFPCFPILDPSHFIVLLYK